MIQENAARSHDLLPCPFCGKQVELDLGFYGGWSINCYTIGCLMHELAPEADEVWELAALSIFSSWLVGCVLVQVTLMLKERLSQGVLF